MAANFFCAETETMEVCNWEASEEMEITECCCSWEEMEMIEDLIWEEMELMEVTEIEYWCVDIDFMECVDSSGDIIMIDNASILESLYNKYRLLLSDLAESFMDWEDVTGDAIMVMLESS